MDFGEIITTYGVEASVLALIVIMLIGVVKIMFKKQFTAMGPNAAKPIYESLSIILSYGLTALWLYIAVAALEWKDVTLSLNLFGGAGSMTYVVVKVIYPLYENYHIRDFVVLIGQAFMDVFGKKGRVADTKTDKTSVATVAQLAESVKEVTTPSTTVNETLPASKKK